MERLDLKEISNVKSSRLQVDPTIVVMTISYQLLKNDLYTLDLCSFQKHDRLLNNPKIIRKLYDDTSDWRGYIGIRQCDLPFCRNKGHR